MVVTVAQLAPHSVTMPMTWPCSVMAHMPSLMPERVPLPMVKVLRQLLESQLMM